MQGMTLEMETKKTDQKQQLTEMKMMGNVMQKQVVNKTYAYMEMQGQKIDLEGEQLEEMILSTAIFPEITLDLEIAKMIGLTDVDRKKTYEIKFSESQTHFYDKGTHLKIQTLQTIEIMRNVQTSTIKYEDYKSVDGIYFPHKTTVSAGPQEIDFITQTIELNSTLEESLFK